MRQLKFLVVNANGEVFSLLLVALLYSNTKAVAVDDVQSLVRIARGKD